MKEKIDNLLTELESRLSLLNCSIEEFDEIWGEDGYVDAMDASGGNFDDAYDLGYSHGEMFAESALLKDIIAKLKEIN